MTETIKEITQEDYETHCNMPYKDLCDWVENIAAKSHFPPCGYGFYGCRIYSDDDKYYVAWTHQTSCD